MTRRFLALVTGMSLTALGCLTAHPVPEDQPAGLGFHVPDGFEVSLYADDSLATDIYSMTIDARGRIVVAGRGYVKTLHDTDGDGTADRATLFSEKPASGAHGMYFDGPHLITSGDNGLWWIPDRDGDGRADEGAVRWSRLLHPEHGTNGITKGPDGWFYVICGNDAGVSSEHARLPSSPVKEPVCGAVVRFAPGGATSEIYAHGFRNPYDIAFNPYGHLFTVDADGERDHQLPWYTPNRLFDIAQGMEHGWLIRGWTRSWNRPEWFYDNVDRLVEIGRGSPTGVEVYRHWRFPERYRHGVFSICWTFGRVYFHHLERARSSYRGVHEVFMSTAGSVGFAPVDLVVDPAGDLYVAIGGRGTRGSVFRVRYRKAPRPRSGRETSLDIVLRADQPLSSWSRAAWVPLARRLGQAAFEEAAADSTRSAMERIRAVEILVELFGGLPSGVASRIVSARLEDTEPELAARVAWALSRTLPKEAERREEAEALVARLTHARDPRVLRAAWEAIASWPAPPEEDTWSTVDWRRALRSRERRVRWAALLAARVPARGSFLESRPAHAEASERERLAPLWVQAGHAEDLARHRAIFLRSALDVLRQATDSEVRLEALRLIQLGLGDLRTREGPREILTGYTAKKRPDLERGLRHELVRVVSATLPSGLPELNRELARTLSMLEVGDPEALGKLATLWTNESSPLDDIHYLMVASHLPAPRSSEFTERSVVTLLGLREKLRSRGLESDRNWPVRIGETFDGLLENDAGLAATLVAHPRFGRPEHSLYARHLQGSAREKAIRKLMATAERLEAEGDSPWTPELVALVGELPRLESLPVLRRQWDNLSLRDGIALVLARHRQKADGDRLVESLDSSQSGVVLEVATALRTIASPRDEGGDVRVREVRPEEIAAALKALRRLLGVKNGARVRREVVSLIEHWTGEDIAISEGVETNLRAVYRPWFDWFAKAYPETADTLAGPVEIDAATWKTKLSRIDWDSGDARRGFMVFERKSCGRCHAGSRRLGPELVGITARFSRGDLFEAILYPDKDISPSYEATQIITASGDVHTGLPIYASVAGTLLQTGPDTTARVTGSEIVSQTKSRASLMPAGLLDDLSDGELADLYAYLQVVGK